jgi:RNA polymerase sigma-70 factor, ECF subfamily
MRHVDSIPSEIPSAALPGEMGGMSPDTTVNGEERRDAAAQVDALYQQHSRMVLGYLYRRLPTLSDAEDVLAEVFLAALRHCAQGDEPGPGWLLLVARRRVADFYRERQRMPPAYEPAPGAPVTEVEDTRPQPEAAMIRAEEQREIAALIAQLPEEQREALALRFGAGLRSPQIAEVLGKSDEATRALLSRAVRRLRKEWVR